MTDKPDDPPFVVRNLSELMDDLPSESKGRIEARANELRAEVDANPDLLQTLEYTLEEVRRLQRVVRILIEKMAAGERLSDAELADYKQQMDTVDGQRERMEQMLAGLRQTGGER